jgi:hypothetical protein
MRRFAPARYAAIALALSTTLACAAGGAPSTRADIAGVVTALDITRGSMLIEEDPSQTSGSDKASVSVGSSTQFFARSGGALSNAALADVRIGQRVEAWFDGPVAESYPVQAKARTIVIVR